MSSIKNHVVDLIPYPKNHIKLGVLRKRQSFTWSEHARMSLFGVIPDHLWGEKKGHKFQCLCSGVWRLWPFSFYSEFTEVDPPPKPIWCCKNAGGFFQHLCSQHSTLWMDLGWAESNWANYLSCIFHNSFSCVPLPHIKHVHLKTFLLFGNLAPLGSRLATHLMGKLWPVWCEINSFWINAITVWGSEVVIHVWALWASTKLLNAKFRQRLQQITNLEDGMQSDVRILTQTRLPVTGYCVLWDK